jgi:uncharacterized membrane protein YkvI
MVLVWSIGAAVLNSLIGVLVVLGVFALMEKHVAAGAFGGIALGTVVVYTQATLGETYLTVTVSEMKTLVILASLGAVVGVVGTVLVVKPELE